MRENIIFPNFRVDNKVALITGGNKGIGRACALALANAGANIVIAARDLKNIEKVKKAIRLSEDKYCSVLNTLKGSVEITSDWKIVE